MKIGRTLKAGLVAGGMAAIGVHSFSQTAGNSAGEIRILELQGDVEIARGDSASAWTPAHASDVLHPSDRLRTGGNSRVALRWSDQSIVPFGASTELEVLPPSSQDDQCGLQLAHGILSFFHRDKPGHIRIVTHGAVAGVEGTEFLLAADDAGDATLSVVDGKVKLSNDQGSVDLVNGEQATVAPGKAPTRTAGFIANNLLQWCFYYPAVIDPDELQLTTDEQNDLAGSLTAYRSGDLLAALAQYPAGRQNVSDRELVYHAELLLSVGEVEKSQNLLSSLSDKSSRSQQLATALDELIAAVKRQAGPPPAKPELASELLAGSYLEQSHAIRETSLQNALNLAKQATVVSPKFGFAWERAAELEFSFGHTRDALRDLDTSLALAPRNAQALALKGFVFAADNKPREARDWFDRAIAADSALGNAWLGRGLVRIHLGDKSGGREDLLVAAALEPQRAELRSYLGKAYVNSGDDVRATKELTLAKKLDPNDPTAWLYSALLNQQDSQINDAIRDLEKSQSLNDNRSVYRSQLLLDEDRAVRSANLANIYQDAGMFDLGVREAGRAVSADYANYSAHLFLANSYEQLRGQNWGNLRYDTPAISEFWIANLLAPTGAGWLSSGVSQQPYAKLFDQNHFGVVSDTIYQSRGAWAEGSDVYYTSDRFSYDIGTTYQSDPGQRPNEDFESREVDVNVKGQLTANDSIFGAVQIANINHGDNNEYYNPSGGDTAFRDNEWQKPNVFLGYHHEWSPGVQTLFFASRREADQSATTDNAIQYVGVFTQGIFSQVGALYNLNEDQKASPEEYSLELQQIWEQANHTTVIGSRYEWGDVHYHNTEGNIFDFLSSQLFPDPSVIAAQDFSLDVHHLGIYGYHTWQIANPLALTVGLSYDELHQPADVATPPFNTQEKTTAQISPKAGFVWTPATNTILRGAYTRSLSGFAGGQSFGLEPTEVAGFNQAYRSLIPESVAGDTSGSQFDTFDLSLEQKFDTGTYLALSGEILYSKLHELEGDFVWLADSPLNYSTYPLGLNKTLNYRERSLTFTADQLLGKQWSAGLRYSVSQAELNLSYPDINPANLTFVYPPFQARQSLDSVLHMLTLHANWNHPSGLFSIFEANWYHQSNDGFSPAEPGDDFWQFNAYGGYRFWHRKAELTVGLLNITDQNYQLEPLNLYNEMARNRTLFARLLISF